MIIFSRWGTGDVPFWTTTYEDTGEYTAEAALDENPVPTHFFIAGDSSTFNQLVATFNEISKRNVTIVDKGSVEELKALFQKNFKENPENIYGYIPHMYQYGMVNGKGLHGDLINPRYPNVKPTNIRTFLQKHFDPNTSKI